MTLIATVVSRHGIIQASDSNLTNRTGLVAAGPKVFRLGFADGALALAGAYGVGSEPMNMWMPACIASYSASAAPSLSGFANHLAAQIQSSTTPEKLRLFHIAGYANDANGVHPEFYFVRNAQSINATTGAYEDITSTYQVTEDFWTRDYRGAPAGMFAVGGFQRYFNGTPPGRIAYLGAAQMLRQFYEQVWNKPTWRFRRPASIDELAAFVRLELETIKTLYMSSDYPSPSIGGDVQIEKIPAPSGALVL